METKTTTYLLYFGSVSRARGGGRISFCVDRAAEGKATEGLLKQFFFGPCNNDDWGLASYILCSLRPGGGGVVCFLLLVFFVSMGNSMVTKKTGRFRRETAENLPSGVFFWGRDY